jgi:hypothetical protein
MKVRLFASLMFALLGLNLVSLQLAHADWNGLDCQVSRFGRIEKWSYISRNEMEFRYDETSPVPTATAHDTFSGGSWTWQMDLVSGEATLSLSAFRGAAQVSTTGNSKLGAALALGAYVSPELGEVSVECQLSDAPGKSSAAETPLVPANTLLCQNSQRLAWAEVGSNGRAELVLESGTAIYHKQTGMLNLSALDSRGFSVVARAPISSGMPVSFQELNCSVR